MNEFSNDKKKIIAIVMLAIVVLAIVLLVLVVNNKYHKINNTNVEEIVQVQNIDNSINNNATTEQNTTEEVTEVVDEKPEEQGSIENLTSDYNINEYTESWLWDTQSHKGIEILGYSDTYILSAFNAGDMFNFIDTSELFIPNEWSWFVAIDKSNQEYTLYVSLYDIVPEDKLEAALAPKERTGTKPIKIVVRNEETKKKIDWCIENYPKDSGYITEGLSNAQYILYIRDEGKDSHGFNENLNYANTRIGNNWAGINFGKLLSSYIYE